MVWDLIDTGLGTPTFNMEFDKDVLDSITSKTLHLYLWDRPCISYGYFLDPKKSLNTLFLQEQKISLVKRPTGGGIVFHGYDYAFSLLVPPIDPLYQLEISAFYTLVNAQIIEALKPLKKGLTLLENPQGEGLFCMAKPVVSDVMLGGKKLLGAAVRKKKSGLIYQGMIGLSSLPHAMCEAFVKKQDFEAYTKHAAYLCDPQEDLESLRHRLKQLLKERFCR